jgi:GTPase SAR1 family protein
MKHLSPDSPITDRADLVDRDSVVDQIREELAPGRTYSCCLIGGWGMGKTSLLNYLKQDFIASRKYYQQTLIPIFFRPEGEYPSLTHFYVYFLRRTRSEVRKWLRK